MASTGTSDPMMKLENTEKRDTLIKIEQIYQEKWQAAKVFEADAPTLEEMPGASQHELHSKHPKSFVNFAYPYMNGTLHVGHCFTVSKPEFSAGFSRLQGKRVLFPLGYHCTGMPIKACADKLAKEVAMFGKEFEGYKEEETDSAADYVPAPTQAQSKEDITKFTATKGKANAKTIKAKYQFQIMLSQGIPRQELHKFADPQYWLKYFPPLTKQDLTRFGARIDWRRQFVTTDANPYYDAFVRWQMNRLHEQDKIKFGSRYTIYSPKDGQPCMDHDRDEGEAILPQEYTALKLKVIEWSPKASELIKGKIPSSANVYFVPATLRPETMYGQVCCFVGPNIKYGIFKASENEYYVFTKRAAWNLSFQGHFFDSDSFPKEDSVLKSAIEFPGSEVVGTLVHAPLSVHKNGVRILPMETVLATKGTGVVTSVPSDSPDDYATVRELAKKPEYYGIKKEWADIEIQPIIKIDSDEPHGNIIAKYLVEEKYKIQSPKDTAALAKAKDDAYKDGYYKGSMLIGEFKGESVENAKPKVRESLIQKGEAFAYAEPGGRVVSRSGDECVVAYLGQWFLDYGEGNPEWRDSVIKHLHSSEFEPWSSESENAFDGVLGWLNRWACARSFGLGSRLPWDKKFLVESLSDSTIYMSYYTIAHFLHKDMFGKEQGLLNIKPEQMTDEVWDYVMTRTEMTKELVEKSAISKEKLEILRRQLEYWYPFDMRTSGKDLIPNHLTFCLYIHAALFPPNLWPRSIRVNGHLLLNGAKMSKSKGNFLTINDACTKFGADATRIALADAGDGVDDANFDESVANSNILRLYNLKEWCEEIAKDRTLRTDDSDNFFDKLFENEMNQIIHEAYKHYEATDYKLALKSSLYDFTSARDFYREAAIASGAGMHKDLVLKYIEYQALLLSPITPHWSDYIWCEVLNKPNSIQLALWPKVDEPIPSLTAAREYVRATSSAIMSAEGNQLKKKSKGKTISFDPKLPKKLTIFAAASFPAWQNQYIELVRQEFEATGLQDDKDLVARIKKMGDVKKAMPFVQGLKRSLQAGEKPSSVFDRTLSFDELKVLEEMAVGLKKTTGCKEIEVVLAKEGGKVGELVFGAGATGSKIDNLPQSAEGAVPGEPTFFLQNIAA